MIDKSSLNAAALWSSMAVITGGGSAIYPDLVTKPELTTHTEQVRAEFAAVSGASIDIMLDLIEDAIIELEAIPQTERTHAQNEKLSRLLKRRQKLMRLIEKADA